MIAFYILLAVACAAGYLDVLTTNRGIANGASETTWMLPGKPSPADVWLINVAQVVAVWALSFLAMFRVWPWIACDIFPAMLVLAHGVVSLHNWSQAFPKK